MSELTPCNWCNVRRTEERAKAEGRAVVMRAGPAGGLPYPADIQVFVVDVDEWGNVGDPAPDAKPAMYLMGLTLRCVC